MIAWFVRNGVAANLLMVLILAGGIVGLTSVDIRMFPKTELRTVSVTVFYPGAAPEERQARSPAAASRTRTRSGQKESPK